MVKIKFLYLLSGLLSIIGGIRIIRFKVFEFRYMDPLYLGEYSNYIGFIIILFGLLLIYYSFVGNNHKIEFSKCPKCKESFNYYELDNGKCNYCEEVDTIDIDKYYEKYPEEIKNKKI